MATQVTTLRELATPPTKRAERFAVVQALRGIAALAVVWFHFTNGNEAFLPNGLLKDSGRYGWLGLDVFFVISGFVLPYSLWAAGYTSNPTNYRRFLWKRISRLDPPYFASILIVVVLAYISLAVPGYRGLQPKFSALQLLLHVGYLTALFGKPWINVVYWSLAIEFQYYILIGLLFPMLSSRKRGVRIGLLLLLGASAIAVQSGTYVFHYLFLFVLGFAAFYSRTAMLPIWELVIICIAATIGTGLTRGIPAAVAGLTAAIVIAFLDKASSSLVFWGELSYSLYLVHSPVGGRIINLGERLGGGTATKLGWLVLAFAVSTAVAYSLWAFVERPCRRYAANIRFLSR